MVKVYVGEGEYEEEFIIPKPEIDRRPSLSDPQIGCTTMMNDGTLKLDSPCFRSFHPDDFRFVAEFLSTGKFGRSFVAHDNEEGKREMFAECAVTWAIADRLVLEDLLDHIVAKIQQTRPWGMVETWWFAKTVYQTEGSALEAYTVMKDMIAEAIADDFHELAIAYGSEFIGPLRELPELQRDVYKRLTAKAEAKLEE